MPVGQILNIMLILSRRNIKLQTNHQITLVYLYANNLLQILHAAQHKIHTDMNGICFVIKIGKDLIFLHNMCALSKFI